MANTQKINETQAKEFAYAFLSDIGEYIKRNKDAYIMWLAKTGNTDNTIFENTNTAEADR